MTTNKISSIIPVREWLLPVAGNLTLQMLFLGICRMAFMCENWNKFSDVSMSDMLTIYKGGAIFDWATVCYLCSLYLLMVTLPLPFLRKTWYRMTTKVLFVTVAALCWIANLMDSVYFQFIGRRCTASVFTEFRNDNVTDIIGIEFLSHWYFILLFLVMLVAMWKLYRQPRFCAERPVTTRQLIQSVVMTLFVAVMTIGGIRGGFDPEQRPINNKDAKEYAPHPIHSALVLNTPYSIIRTMGKSAFPHLEYYGESEAESIYSPVHPAVPVNSSRPNVAIIILESFGSEYSAYLNGRPEEKGYMPFLDSLMREGLTFESTFSNGHSSIDGQASVHLSVPLMVISFFTSHAALNEVRGVATELRDMGYHTAYFHGADNGSLGLDGFAKSVGYDNYYGRTEYANDDDWDHHWGIWDEPFLQFYARKMSEMPQPFITTLFTLTSHHPFQIPEKYREVFKEGDMPIYKTVRYTDMSLRRFFETAKRQPWYDNTLFVITGDHTNQSAEKYYQTDYGTYRVPVLFYHPSDSTFRSARKARIAQHIDIMPTVLGYTGCKQPYVAFGTDLLHSDDADAYHIGFGNDTYQITQGGMLLQFDGERSTALYNVDTDSLLQHNLIGEKRYEDTRHRLERRLKAVIQSYMTRMNNNALVVK